MEKDTNESNNICHDLTVTDDKEPEGDFLYLDEKQLQLYAQFYSEYTDDTETETPYGSPDSITRLESKITNRMWRQDFMCSAEIDKKKYRNVYCVNCGEKGHVVRDCDGPITSFGIIAFKICNSPIEEIFDRNLYLDNIIKSLNLPKSKNYPKVKLLMIQRKDTMGYIDFVRGKYPDNNPKIKNQLLKVCLQEMTQQEKHNLLTQSFSEIWDNLWVNHESKTYKNEFQAAKAKYEKLDIKSLVENSATLYKWPEFGFPKGRRNMRETNITCAEREFLEETGYSKIHYDFIKNYPTIHEEFIGTNGVKYRHIYYLVKMRDNVPAPQIDQSNMVQTGEVQNIGWFSYDECMGLIRPYDTAKKHVIEKVHQDILNMNDQYVCSNFYYNSKKHNFVPSQSDYRSNWFSHKLN